MKRITCFIVFVMLLHSAIAQNIGDFTSVIPIPSYQQLNIPNTHSFQVLLQEGDSCNNGVLPGLFDFTCFIPQNGSSRIGQLSLNHENVIGDVSISNIELDTINNLWQINNIDLVDFSSVAGTFRPCSGNLTPWGTLVYGEEYTPSGDLDSNGLLDAGWLVEVDCNTRTVIQKIWSAGRTEFENAVVTKDSNTLYTGGDNVTFGFVYKYVPYTKGVLDSGDLFVLKVNGNAGTWLHVPNTTDSQKNNTANVAYALGATNFVGVEDVELGPDGKVYFAAKGPGNVYRFLDNDTTVSMFDTFVNNQVYLINWGLDSAMVPWGIGADNMAFDGDGNLWVLQDGGNSYIWTVGPNHSDITPAIKLFGRVPQGAEPTGITFSPDYKYLFMSIQHPFVSNIDTQIDAAGQTIQWNKSIALVIARNEDLEPVIPTPASTNLNNVKEVYLNVVLKNNPVKRLAYFTITGQGYIDIVLFDIYGRKIKQIENNSQKELTINMGDLHSGLYIARFTNREGREVLIKIIKQ